MVNREQILTHLLTKVLELDTEDIKIIIKVGYGTYRKFTIATCNNLNSLRNRKDLSQCAWRELTDWSMYANMTSLSYASIMTMTSETWDSVDGDVGRIHYALAKTTIVTDKPSVTADTVLPTQIDATLFLKYVSVHLIDKSQLLNFYKN